MMFSVLQNPCCFLIGYLKYDLIRCQFSSVFTLINEVGKQLYLTAVALENVFNCFSMFGSGISLNIYLELIRILA